ncbi:hypothetical protein BGZ97_007529 [Linnemannia gamsii]|jgi:hypothetical protein|uniref:Uncharacterized protein n=1 Tax=Linnemannia gamsii TaxID=64522 RepID=A0A9P6QQJ9_9FUNG|nr:hypothetical protein BGZ97_007529 [Linnemannia gamsii]
MSNNTTTNIPSICTTTITTTDSGNRVTILANMLQSELDRKLADLKDIHKAYNGILANWKDDKPALPPHYCHVVTVCWARSIKMWQYQLHLEAAAAKIEVEIAQFRKEILDVLMNVPIGSVASLSD